MLDVPVWVWLATVAGLLAVVAVDLLVVDHDPHGVSLNEAGFWVGVYIVRAVLFGIGLLLINGPPTCCSRWIPSRRSSG